MDNVAHHGTNPVVRICDRPAFPAVLDMKRNIRSIRSTDFNRGIVSLYEINSIIIRAELSKSVTATRTLDTVSPESFLKST